VDHHRGDGSLCRSLGRVYALAQTEWYRAEVLLAPADETSGQGLGGQLGGLAALAGVSVGGAVMSRPLLCSGRENLRAHSLRILIWCRCFSTKSGTQLTSAWLGDDPEEWPEIRDAIKYFHENMLKVARTAILDWSRWLLNGLIRRLPLNGRELVVRQ
jgi:hypothetical protein